MARREPELFYHPVVGALSPTTVGLWNLQDLFKPQPPKPVPSVIRTPEAPEPSSFLPPIHERKAMTLARTSSCAVTGEILPQARMIRFVISPDRQVVPDLTEKLPGPFLWISADRHILKKAIWRNSFAGTVRENVEIPENLLEIIESGLGKLALQTLSMAKRAGELVSGFTKVDEALRSRHTSVYVVASDSSENGREKLERLAHHQEIPVIDEWSSAELSHALGEQNINHVSLKAGGLAKNLVDLVEKLKAVKTEK